MVTSVIGYNINEVYEILLLLCKQKSFKIIEKNFENKIIKAKKNSLLFWKNLNIELQLFTFADNDVVKISVKIFSRKVLHQELEEKFVDAINKSL